MGRGEDRGLLEGAALRVARLPEEAGTNEWFPVGVSVAAREVAAEGALAAIVGVMRAAGLEQVPESTLDDPVPDRLTEMDDLPATVRDVLFCEVC